MTATELPNAPESPAVGAPVEQPVRPCLRGVTQATRTKELAMKCYPCGFEGDKKEFGTLDATGSQWATLIGRMPTQHVGSVDVYVCPRCGALHTNMRGLITAEDRKA